MGKSQSKLKVVGLPLLGLMGSHALTATPSSSSLQPFKTKTLYPPSNYCYTEMTIPELREVRDVVSKAFQIGGTYDDGLYIPKLNVDFVIPAVDEDVTIGSQKIKREEFPEAEAEGRREEIDTQLMLRLSESLYDIYKRLPPVVQEMLSLDSDVTPLKFYLGTHYGAGGIFWINNRDEYLCGSDYARSSLLENRFEDSRNIFINTDFLMEKRTQWDIWPYKEVAPKKYTDLWLISDRHDQYMYKLMISAVRHEFVHYLHFVLAQFTNIDEILYYNFLLSYHKETGNIPKLAENTEEHKSHLYFLYNFREYFAVTSEYFLGGGTLNTRLRSSGIPLGLFEFYMWLFNNDKIGSTSLEFRYKPFDFDELEGAVVSEELEKAEQEFEKMKGKEVRWMKKDNGKWVESA